MQKQRDQIEQHQERLCRLIESTGLMPDWPVDDETVVEIFDHLEYVVDLEKIHIYLAAGYITPPAIVAGKRSWTLKDFIELQVALEMRRQWRAFSKFHDPKKSHWQLEKERAEAAGDQKFFSDIDRYSVEDLILYLTQADERYVREAIGLALKTKLEMHDG
ncbi:MAG: hypothetical protein CMJ47_02860 [Planctomyces sp.]|nr:hypothetical protein [Planctomyces sp.]